MIKVLDCYRTEADLVRISRVCTGRADKVGNENNAIKALVRMGHWAVFEHGSMSFYIEAPIYVMRQWMRHDGAWMEKSRRYTKDAVSFGELSGEVASNFAYGYKMEVALGAKPEDARKCLPLDLMTQCIWTPDLRCLFHFLRLRLDSHAQKEMRELAMQVAVEVALVYPNAFEAFAYDDFLAVKVGCGEGIEELLSGQKKIRDNRNTIKEVMERVKDRQKDCEEAKLPYQYSLQLFP